LERRPGPDQLIADFDFSIDPPADATTQNSLTLSSGAAPAVLRQDIDADWNSVPSQPRAPIITELSEMALPQIADLPPAQAPSASEELFSAEYRSRSIEDFAQFVPADAPDRESLIAKFTATFDEAVAAHQSDSPPLNSTSLSRDGDDVVLTHHLPHGDFEVLRVAAVSVTDCQTWWAELVYNLTAGFLSALGLPIAPGKIGSRILNAVWGNTTVKNLINAMIQELQSQVTPVRVIALALGIVAAIAKAGLLWTILKWVITWSAWQLAWWVFKNVVMIAAVPEAKGAAVIVGLTKWAVNLLKHAGKYPTACPNS
jgi:hypothetical protein